MLLTFYVNKDNWRFHWNWKLVVIKLPKWTCSSGDKTEKSVPLRHVVIYEPFTSVMSSNWPTPPWTSECCCTRVQLHQFSFVSAHTETVRGGYRNRLHSLGQPWTNFFSSRYNDPWFPGHGCFSYSCQCKHSLSFLRDRWIEVPAAAVSKSGKWQVNPFMTCEFPLVPLVLEPPILSQQIFFNSYRRAKIIGPIDFDFI